MYIKKGYLLYEPKDIKRNAGFIELFLAEARQKNITLSLLYANDQRLLRAKKTDEHSLADALGNPDFIISRSRTPSLSKMLEQSGIRVYNNADICRICNDKQLTYEYMKKQDIPCMDTVCMESFGLESSVSFQFYKEQAAQFGYPFVLKPADGHGGKHVCLIKNKEQLYHELTLIRIDYGFLPKLLFQRCADVIGKDLRIYVLGNKMLAAMMRISSGSDFRANFSLGGHAIPHTLTNEETALAKKIITALPADFVGIDFLYHKDHPVLSEIEDVVGTRMLYQHTNIHAVREYLNYILLSMQNTTA